MKHKIIFGLILMVIFLNSIFFVSSMSDAEVKNVLKKSLFLYFNKPLNTTLTLDEYRDLLVFYLNTEHGIEIVDLSKIGDNSKQSVQAIISKALMSFIEINTTRQYNCTSGWRCVTDFDKEYQKMDCSWWNKTFCEFGCLNGECKPAPVIRDCSSYGSGFWCGTYEEWKLECNSIGQKYAANCTSGDGIAGGYCIKCLNCTDSDGGKNYYIKGTATGGDSNGYSSLTDSCAGGPGVDIRTLAEAYCSGNTILKENYICPNGCKDGACIAGPLCGNNIKESGEVCDGSDLGGQSCVGQGFNSGTLSCNINCSGFDTIGCVVNPTCSKCSDCDTLFTSCSYQECKQDCGIGCYYRGVIPLLEDCVDLSYACSNLIKGCSDYSKEECGNNPCKLISNCKLVGSDCVDMVCTTNCTGRQCGDNGCQGSCGQCQSGYNCINHTCMIIPPICANDVGCDSTGAFCEGNTPYTCTLGGDGCLDKVNGKACLSNKTCINGVCSGVIPECTSDIHCPGGHCTGGRCNYGNGRIFYLDPIYGSTATGNGSKEDPWGSLQSVIEAGYFNSGIIDDGDTLKLMSGYHGELNGAKFLSTRKKNSEFIFIESDIGADVKMSRLMIENFEKWKFKGIKFSPSYATPSLAYRRNPPINSSVVTPYIVSTDWMSSYIIFENCIFQTVEDDSKWDINDWTLTSWECDQGGSNWVLKDNIIKNVRKGLRAGENSTVENNLIDGFSDDGMRVGGTNLVIRNNTVINGYANNAGNYDPSGNWHMDLLQIGKGDQGRNITIEGNYLNCDQNQQRTPRTGCQGIFMQPDVLSGRIQNNVVVANNAVHGISQDTGTQGGLIVSNNTVIPPYNYGDWPNIYFKLAGNLQIKNNIVELIGYNTSSNISLENNFLIRYMNLQKIFYNYSNNDFHPVMASDVCNGSINSKGVAVGALPCVCTTDSECAQVFGSGSTCNLETKECS